MRGYGNMRPAVLALVALAALFASAVGAASSSAALRTYENKMSQLNGPSSVAFDAQGRVWATDLGQGKNPPGIQGIYLFDAYPSQTIISEPNTNEPWGFASRQLQVAVNKETDEVFFAMSNPRTVDVFDELGVYDHSWTAINGFKGGTPIHIAIDNSNGTSRGRVYLSLTSPENAIEVFDDQQRPVDFPATADYIEGNTLTGTPSGPFGAVYFVSVDEEGNLYVTDPVKDVVNQFAWTGEFVRSFPAPRASFAEGTNGYGGVAVDPTNGHVAITENTWNGFEGGITEFDRWGNFLGRLTDDPNPGLISPNGTPAVDANGRLYVPAGNDYVTIFGPAPPLSTATYGSVTGETTQAGTVHAEVDPNGGAVTACHFEYGTYPSYGLGTVPCSPDPASSPPASSFSAPTEVSAGLSGLTTGTTYHYRVVMTNSNGIGYGSDQTYTPQALVGLRTEPATEVEERNATLNASLLGDGSALTYHFEWGRTVAYGNVTAPTPGGSPAGPNRTALQFQLDSLEPYTTYHYRVVATGGGSSTGEDRVFTTPPGIPTIGAQRVTEVHSDRAVMHGEVNPNGADTTYHFEYVDDQAFQESGFAEASKFPAQEIGVGMSKTFQEAEAAVDGLNPGTLYHYRLVGTNSAGVGVPTVDRTFTTYRFGFEDKCPNAHVRQQTGSALLLDCRAYELASAANAGGYDVASDMVEGQEPFGQFSYAQTSSQVLYGVHEGGIPGTGRPTNRGLDPYVAVRGESGWVTRYVGISADNPFADRPFGSPLMESDSGLSTFVFGGEGICDPCFADGSSGEPVRLSDGSLVQGMQGSIDPGPTAAPSGFIGRHLSADGSHYVFGSTAQFEPDGNSNGDVSIYVRDLESGGTTVVSKTPGGTTMTGPGIGQLDISTDGDRVVFGRLVSTDSAGNRLWHLYMNVAGAEHSIDLMPTANEGALYSGMSADGTEVYLSSAEGLATGDDDSSIDIYRADVGAADAALSRVSTGDGSAGNTDACDPSANTVYERWNSLGAAAVCDVLAVGGGAGVPADNGGGIYFLSPENLDAEAVDPQPVAGAPNLYLSTPGSEPAFVRTLESSSNAPLPPASHPFERSFGGFANPTGTAIDPLNGDVYVLDVGADFGATGYVLKYDSEGNSSLGFGSNGKLAINGAFGVFNLPVGIAVDTNPASPNYRNLFVPNLQGNSVRAYDPVGNGLFSIEAPFPTSVAVDSSTGNIYISSFFGGVFAFDPTGAPLGFIATIGSPTDVAVHGGKVYVVNGGGPSSAAGTAHVYDTAGADLGELDAGPARGVAVDPSDGHVFIDRGSRVVEYDAAEELLPTEIGVGQLSSSFDLSASEGRLAISNRGSGNVAIYGPLVTEPDPATDSALVMHSLGAPYTRFPGDFQVTPSGDFAAFGSTLSLTGYDNGGHSEVFRYDTRLQALDCASCNPTGEQATGDASLAARGLSLTNDGRVFFNSTEGLVDRDLNEKRDAYEWKPGEGIELVSTGAAAMGASLLGVSADGVDAFFFTREKLVSGDENGSRVKLYDARSHGGYPYVPPPVPCKAADECRGPGSAKPPAPVIGSVTGTPVGNAKPLAKKCKSGKKKKKKCGRKGKRRKQKQARRGSRR